MNYSREELTQSDATMNQMRNAIYHLERFMKINGVHDIKERIQRMGKNIAKTYIKSRKPIGYVNLDNLKDVIATIYKNVLNSNVSIELDENSKTLSVKDNDCALCKYPFSDVEVAGCELIVSLVTEFINLINEEAGIKSIKLESVGVMESRTMGHNSCIQNYKYSGGK